MAFKWTAIIRLFLTFLMFVFFVDSYAEAAALPKLVKSYAGVVLTAGGTGKYRKLGFDIYRVTLWTPGKKWDQTKPFALQLHYLRAVDKDTLTGTVKDDIKEQNVADKPTLAHWNATIDQMLPGVRNGDEIVGISVPGKESLLFMNGKKIGHITEQKFSKAFFNIWLGSMADRTLRGKLLAYR